MTLSFFNNKKAFTLAEILIVIAIFGLLATIIFAVTRGAGEQGRIARGLYFSQHLQNSLGAHLVGRWSFDEGTGTTANDTSGWGNNGILVNGPTWRCASVDPNYTPSKQGCSLEFDGVNDYVDMSSAWGGIPNTFEAWLKIPTTIPDLTRVGIVAGNFPDTNSINWEVFQYGRPRVYWNSGEINWVLNIDLRTGEWLHFVFVRDKAANKFYFYLDGVLKETYNFVGTDITPATFSRIGNDKRTAPGVPFRGLIDEVRIYDRSLAAAEIQKHYIEGIIKRGLVKN